MVGSPATGAVFPGGTFKRPMNLKQYCPHCHTVLSHEITLGEDDPTISLEAIKLYA
jgi:hypothetical protein